MASKSAFLTASCRREIALSHHENWDGSGYPVGLAGDAIPETGRIVAVVDVYDALMNDRAYSPALPEDEALSLMRMGKGNHFDPKVLDCFLDLLTEIQCIGEDQKELGNPVFKSLTP